MIIKCLLLIHGTALRSPNVRKLYMVSKALMEYAAFTCAAYESCKFPEIFFSISSGKDFSMLKVHRERESIYKVSLVLSIPN